MSSLWNTLIQAVAGSGPAQELRNCQYYKEVARKHPLHKRREEPEILVCSISVQEPPTVASGPGAVATDQDLPVASPKKRPQPIQTQPAEEFPLPKWATYQKPTSPFRNNIHYEVQSPPPSTTACDFTKPLGPPTPKTVINGVGDNSPSVTSNDNSDHSGSGNGIDPVNNSVDAISSESPHWVGVGRFRHPSNVDPKWLKAKWMEEVCGAGAQNFFGGGGPLGEHPFERQFKDLCKSTDNSEEEEESDELSPASFMTPPSERLAHMFRTQSSTSVNPDGCIVQKGFVVSKSKSSHSLYRSSTLSLQTTIDEVPDMPELKRCNTEGHHVDEADLAEAQCTAPSRKSSADRAPLVSHSNIRKIIAASVRGGSESELTKALSSSARLHPHRCSQSLSLASGEDAEDAIASDSEDEDSEDAPIQMAPVKRERPSLPLATRPLKSILKKTPPRLSPMRTPNDSMNPETKLSAVFQELDDKIYAARLEASRQQLESSRRLPDDADEVAALQRIAAVQAGHRGHVVAGPRRPLHLATRRGVARRAPSGLLARAAAHRAVAG